MSDAYSTLPEGATPVKYQDDVFNTLPLGATPIRLPSPPELLERLQKNMSYEGQVGFNTALDDITRDAEDPEAERARIINSMVLSSIIPEDPTELLKIHDQLAREWTGADTTPQKFSEELWQTFKQGFIPAQMAPLVMRQIFGDMSPELEQRIQEIEALLPEGFEMPETTDKALQYGLAPQQRLLETLVFEPEKVWISSTEEAWNKYQTARGQKRPAHEDVLLEAANIFAMQLSAMDVGVEEAIKWAGGGMAGLSICALFASSSTVAPLVPVVGALAKVGFQYGTAKKMAQIEAAMSYRAIRSLTFTDTEGNEHKIDPKIASAISLPVGIINGLIEMAQFRTILKPLGGNKLFSLAVKETTQKVLLEGSLKNLILQKVVDGGVGILKNTATEALEEWIQEGVSLFGEEIAKSINNRVKGTEFEAQWNEVLPQMNAVALRTAKGFFLLSSIGGIYSTATGIKSVMDDKAAQARMTQTLMDNIEGLTEGEAQDILQLSYEWHNQIEQQAKISGIPMAEVPAIEARVAEEAEAIKEAALPAEPIPKEAKKMPPEVIAIPISQLKYTEESIGAHHGQVDMVSDLKTPEGEVISAVEYSIFEDEIYINMVTTAVNYRGQGYATELIKKVMSENPGYKLEWGVTTEEGTNLRRSIEAEISEKEIAPAEMADAEVDAIISQGFDDFVRTEKTYIPQTEAEVDAWVEAHQTTAEDLTKPFTEAEWSKKALTQALGELGVAGYAKKGYSPIVIGYIRAATARGALTDEQYKKALKYLNQNPEKYKIAIAELRDELTPEVLRSLGHDVFTGRESVERYFEAEAEYNKATETARESEAAGRELVPAHTRELARLEKWLQKKRSEIAKRVEELEQQAKAERTEGAGGAPPPTAGKGPGVQAEEGGLPAKRKPRKKRTKPDVSVIEASEEARQAKPEDFDKKSFKELEDAWEKRKDIWFQEKDEKLHRAQVERRVLRKTLMSVLGFKRYTDRVRDVASAIHLYIDTKRNPGHLAEYYDQLAKEQRRLVDLSQNLPVEVYGIVAELEASYEKIGLEAQDADVIHNVHENYVNRTWDLKKGSFSELFRKFGVKTRHAKARVFETIIQGMAQGYSLKITDAIDNLAILKEELIKTIEDKRFLKALTPIRDSEGRPLITGRGDLENYTRIEHPNFRSYQYAGSVTLDGISKTLRQIYQERESIKEVEEKGGVAKETAIGPIHKLEEIVQFALESKGFTVGEALNAIERLEDAKNGNHAKTIIKEIEKAVIEREEITGYKFVPASGKNFFIADDGTILERRELYSPQPIAKNLNNILGMSKIKDVPGVQFLTKYNALIKAWILQSSLFHHQAFARSYYLGAGRKKTWSEIGLRKAYQTGMKMVEANDPQVISLVRNGLTIGLSQDYEKVWQYERGVLGTMLDKIGVVKAVRDKVIHLRQLQTDWLFGEFGAGLKTMAALIELRQELKTNPDADPDTTAKNVANLINDDFGGLHLQRMGRNPTLQHIFRLFALAPDWTESNVRTMVKALAPVWPAEKLAEKRGKEYQGISREESSMYRRFWCRAIFKGLGAVAIANYALAGGDLERMMDRYREAWGKGKWDWRRLRWLMIDVTPIYEALGGRGRESKFFNLIGHFRDPFKFILEPFVSMKHKGSVFGKSFMELVMGTDWAGRRFTTMAELLKTGKMVKWEFGGGAVQPEEFLSYALHEIVGSQPIQVQNFISAMTGEIDAFDAVLKSMGIDVRTAYKPKKGK